jgi:UDP-N-acetylglucosamine acyltransferase
MAETRAALKKAYRIVFQSELNVSQALERARNEVETFPEVTLFLDFIRDSERGITI